MLLASGLLVGACCVTLCVTSDVNSYFSANLTAPQPELAQSAAAGAALPGTSALAGLVSPFAAKLPSADNSTPVNRPAQDEAQLGQAFQQSLRDYHAGVSSPEEKNRIKTALHEMSRDRKARALMIEMFFSQSEPQLAQALYGLMRDADLKDVGLLEDLIQYAHRHAAQANAANAGNAAIAARLIDLVADLGAKSQSSYSVAIDRYLTQMAESNDPQLRIRAATQKIWYVDQHQPNNLAAQEKYLADTAPKVREEVYSLIEARIANQTLSGQGQLRFALNAALHAEHLGASAEEKARVNALLQALASTGA